MYGVTVPRTWPFAGREILKIGHNLVYKITGHNGLTRDHTQIAIDKTESVLLIYAMFTSSWTHDNMYGNPCPEPSYL